jgi:hypothetical protein
MVRGNVDLPAGRGPVWFSFLRPPVLDWSEPSRKSKAADGGGGGSEGKKAAKKRKDEEEEGGSSALTADVRRSTRAPRQVLCRGGACRQVATTTCLFRYEDEESTQCDARVCGGRVVRGARCLRGCGCGCRRRGRGPAAPCRGPGCARCPRAVRGVQRWSLHPDRNHQVQAPASGLYPVQRARVRSPAARVVPGPRSAATGCGCGCGSRCLGRARLRGRGRHVPRPRGGHGGRPQAPPPPALMCVRAPAWRVPHPLLGDHEASPARAAPAYQPGARARDGPPPAGGTRARDDRELTPRTRLDAIDDQR